MRNRLHTGTLQHLENLPHTWNLVNLSEFTNLEDGIKPGPFGSSLTKDFYTSSGYRVYGQEQVIAGDLNIGDYFISSSKYLELRSFSIQANDILLSLVGTTGKVLVVPDSFYPGVINPRLIRLRPNLRQTVVGYLKHLLESSIVRHQLNRLSQGGTMEVLSATVLRQLKLPKPSNLPEQRSIAHILDTIDEAIATTTAHIDKLKLAKAGLLHDLLTRGIDDNGELRDPTRHPEQFKASELGLIPKDWDAVPLGAVIASIDAGKSPSCPERPAITGEWGVLKVSAVHPDGFKPEENKAVTNPIHIKPEYQVKDNDLLITRANTYELVGLSCLVESPPSNLLICDKTLRLNPFSEKASKAFLNYTLQMPYVRVKIQNNATGSSAGMKNISQEMIQSLTCLIPRSLEEQTLVASFLDSYRIQLVAKQVRKQKLQLIKKGLMSDLLTGRVRVQVDASEAD